jgi:hypothetical protein
MVAQLAEFILIQLIEFIISRKVNKGIILKIMRVLMRRVLYCKAEVNGALRVPGLFDEEIPQEPAQCSLWSQEDASSVSSQFYWLGMAQDCERWVAECMECRTRKSVQDHYGLPSSTLSSSTR